MTTTQLANPPLPQDTLSEIAAAASAIGCELIHVEQRGDTLRLVLDREEGGVTVDDCQQVSRDASAILDLADFGTRRYTLEVSSPGLDRPLYRARDWERFAGRLIKLKYRDDEGRKYTVRANIESFDRAAAQAVVSVPESGATIELSLSQVESARLEIEL